MLGAMDAEAREPIEAPLVAAYLEEWLEVQRTQVQPSTWSSYRGNVDRYLAPHLGELRLDEITVAGLNRFYAVLLRRGGHKGKPLSLRTVEFAHTVLRKALEDARRLDKIAVNPATDATLPRIDPRDGTTVDTSKVNAWTAEELRTFFEHIAGHRWEPPLTVAATTGVRRGELLGVTWEDVDTERGLLHVRYALSVVDGHAVLKGTKTERPRTLHIDPRTVQVFREQRCRQDRWRQEAGAAWRNGWDLAFTTEGGHYIHPDRFGVEFSRLVETAPVPRIRLHDLRHTHATLLLGEGVPIKVVSERLGHSEVSITLDVYAHCLSAMDEGAAEQFADMIWNGGRSVDDS
jgi:integrase